MIRSHSFSLTVIAVLHVGLLIAYPQQKPDKTPAPAESRSVSVRQLSSGVDDLMRLLGRELYNLAEGVVHELQVK